MDLAGVGGALALALLVLFGFTPGSHGVHISPYVQTQKPYITSVKVVYECPVHIAMALQNDSKLDPNLFCKRVSK